MTYVQWIQVAQTYWNMYPSQRKGQAFFNSLCLNRPDLSEKVRATDLDPFYQDQGLHGFLAWVQENW